jgi:adenylosuccinate lyase
MRLLFLLLIVLAHATVNAATMADTFSATTRNLMVMRVEAALAGAQADAGVIPRSAADEIASRAELKYLPADDLSEEYDRVRHRMVALLNVWRRSMAADASEYVHYGATTVDIYDTVAVLQLRDATLMLISSMRDIETLLIDRALLYRETVMIGRTLGQHALPITFGKKLSTWLGENRRHIERLKQVLANLQRSAIMKGAVGSYLGLGEQAIAVELGVAERLGLDVPFADDWHGSRDVMAEYAQVLALISKSWGRIGTELFLLQSTDIAETVETRPATAVGSSTMPHKNNPSKSEALIHYSRTIPRHAEVVLDDVVNFFERDNTSRMARVLRDISIESDAMLKSGYQLIESLQVDADAMSRNLGRTNQLIMAQRIAGALANDIGRRSANDRLHEISRHALAEGLSLKQAFMDSDLSGYLSVAELDALLDPATYVGLAAEQVDRVVSEVRSLRVTDPGQIDDDES